MLVTKEMLVYIGITTVVTGSIFSIIFSSGFTTINETRIDVIANVELKNDILFLKYTIYNTGDFDIQNVTVTATCCSHTKLLSGVYSIPLINILDSKQYIDVIPTTGLAIRDEIILNFDAYDTFGNRAVDILTVTVE